MGGAKLRLRSSISGSPTLRRHMRISCCKGGKKKKKRHHPMKLRSSLITNELHGKNKQTPRNKPTQLTDHAFSHTNGVVRFLT
jgi:hypothetical protein